MGEQKNLFLAIGLSVAIIIIFQLLVPQQSVMTSQPKDETILRDSSTSIDQEQQITQSITKTKEEIITSDNRVLINAPSLKGSINLKGALLDDLILLKYKESLDRHSKNINLFFPDQKFLDVKIQMFYIVLG